MGLSLAAAANWSHLPVLSLSPLLGWTFSLFRAFLFRRNSELFKTLKCLLEPPGGERFIFSRKETMNKTMTQGFDWTVSPPGTISDTLTCQLLLSRHKNFCSLILIQPPPPPHTLPTPPLSPAHTSSWAPVMSLLSDVHFRCWKFKPGRVQLPHHDPLDSHFELNQILIFSPSTTWNSPGCHFHRPPPPHESAC